MSSPGYSGVDGLIDQAEPPEPPEPIQDRPASMYPRVSSAPSQRSVVWPVVTSASLSMVVSVPCWVGLNKYPEEGANSMM